MILYGWFVGCAAYVGVFVGVQTLRQWKRLGRVPITSLTETRRSRAHKVSEDTVGMGLMAWITFMVLYAWDPVWWTGMACIEAGAAWREGLAALFFGASIVQITVANLTMGESWLMGISDEPLPLVTRGIYDRVRHPIYGAMILYFTAAALIMPNVLVIAAMTLAVTAIRFEAVLEEDYWLRHEPDAYGALIARSHAFFPLPRRSLTRGAGGR